MGVPRSDLFKNDPKLEACATAPQAHLRTGTPAGPHISKIHAALALLRPGGPGISAAEQSAMAYGPATAAAVLQYKKTHVPPIVNTSYQSAPDDIVGEMTIKAMDDELFGTPAPRNDIVDRAFADSRAALRTALRHLGALRADINALPGSSDPGFSAAMVALINKHKRNTMVLARRLLIVPDPESAEFRSALDKVILLCEGNLARGKTILAAGRTGLCDPSAPRNARGLPHAWTVASQPDLLGLADISVTNTAQAFRNANTIAQIVALLTDRFRQVNSDGGEPAVPPLPSP